MSDYPKGAYALKKGRTVRAISLDRPQLWRDAFAEQYPSLYARVVYASDKKRLREAGWDVVAIEWAEFK